MKTISSLTLRQSVTKVLATLRRTGEPILVENGRKPAAVLISLEDYQMRFVDRDAHERRIALIKKILDSAAIADDPCPAEDILRELRGGQKKL